MEPTDHCILMGIYYRDISNMHIAGRSPLSSANDNRLGRYKIKRPVERVPIVFFLNWRCWIGNGAKMSGSQETIVVVNDT